MDGICVCDQATHLLSMRKKFNLTYFLGNAFIAFPLFFLAFIYYPVIQIYLFPHTPELKTTQEKSFYIEIPKISARLPIIQNIDPFDESEYSKALQKGVALSKTTPFQNKDSPLFIFGHSSGAPWEITRYNTAFLRLNELNKGDNITINKNGKKYYYKVVDKKIVSPTEIQYLKDIKKDQLILQTCYPLGTDFQRLLIFAQPLP